MSLVEISAPPSLDSHSQNSLECESSPGPHSNSSEYVIVRQETDETSAGEYFPGGGVAYDDDEDDDPYTPQVATGRSDWHAQFKSLAVEKQRKNVAYHATMMEAASMSLSNRRVAIHILAAEAYHEAVRTGCTHVTRSQWLTILQDAMDDMTFADNSALVMKNLSCMCIFVPGRQSPSYGDNPEDRAHRIQRHHTVLEKLQTTRRLFLCDKEGL